ncbi:MAG: hypothetical protein PHV93_03675 [Candidatus Pacebacteria bacterium]|nr:hypothetical protein [Candidatus Paceibacterota bacterium]
MARWNAGDSVEQDKHEADPTLLQSVLEYFLNFPLSFLYRRVEGTRFQDLGFRFIGRVFEWIDRPNEFSGEAGGKS